MFFVDANIKNLFFKSDQTSGGNIVAATKI